ncbi:hypothetical protein [Giesbergeria anulus]|uniref:hypothetical protein n=1 Tax=Giesbergeria anulus TaxID=180197 RepID=UPI0015A56B67|nr:hypothetical protein [Giesbergeria anulus]
MRLKLFFIFLIAPELAFARDSSGAFWALLSFPLAIIFSGLISTMLDHNGRHSLGSFLIGLFLAYPIILWIGNWVFKLISYQFKEITKSIPEWMVWVILISLIKVLSIIIDYCKRKKDKKWG